MRGLWIDGVSGVVSDLQEYEGRDEDDDAVCGEVVGARAAEYECAGEVEAGGRISTSEIMGGGLIERYRENSFEGALFVILGVA